MAIVTPIPTATPIALNIIANFAFLDTEVIANNSR
jgi:hypothetical protein